MELLKGLLNVFLVLSALISCRVCSLTVGDTEQNTIQKNVEKPRTLYDYQTRVAAYKDLIDSKCLLEILTNNESIITQRLADNGNTWKPITTSPQLTKREIWRMAGNRISDFCRGFPTYLIKPLPNTLDSQNDLFLIRRKRDERHYFVGRIRGQTQSQYLNFDGTSEPGKAEAESSLEGTKAVVTGTNGMGQAQSQSVPIDCSRCFSDRYQDQSLLYGSQSPERLTRPDQSAVRPGHRYTESGDGFEDNNYPIGPGASNIATGRPGDRNRPGQAYPPGSYPIGPGRSRGGSFGGRLSGEYQSHAGQSGKFSGTFEGTYHSEQSTVVEGTSDHEGRLRPGEAIGEISHRPGYGPQPPPGYSDTLQGPRQDGYLGGKPGTFQTPGQTRYPSSYPESGTISGAPHQTDASRGPYESDSGRWVPGSQRGSEGSWLPSSSGSRQPGRGSLEGQWTNGNWVPSSSGPSSITQQGPGAPGQWTPSGTSGSLTQPGQRIEGTWVPSSAGTGSGTQTGPGGQWIDGKWMPSSAVSGSGTQTGPESQGRQWVPSSAGPGGGAQTGPGGQVGQWIDGNWVPSSAVSGSGTQTGPGGQWITGKWMPSSAVSGSGTQTGPESQGRQWVPSSAGPGGGAQTGPGGQVGQWIDGKWVPSSAGTGSGAQTGPGGQWIDGKWVPSSAVSGSGTQTGPESQRRQWVPSSAGPGGGAQTGPGGQVGQWIDGKWVPARNPSGPQQTETPGQLISGKWVPSSGGSDGAAPTGQWINGKWVPSSESQQRPGGQYVDGKWVPSSSGAPGQIGPGTPGGQWIDGKWTPSYGGQEGPGGQWVDGKWVPSSASSGGTTQPGSGAPGQWINGKWVPSSGGRTGTTQAGAIAEGGQWVNGKWIPFTGGPGGTTQTGGSGTGSVPSPGSQGTPGGEWINGKWVPSSDSTTQNGPTGQWGPPGALQTAPGGQWIDGKWVPSSSGIAPGAQNVGTGPGTPGWPSAGPSGQWTSPGGTGPGTPGWSSAGPSGQWTSPGGTSGQWSPGVTGAGVGPSAGGSPGASGQWLPAGQGTGGGQPVGPGGQWAPGQQPYGPGGSYGSGPYPSGPGAYPGSVYSGPGGQVPPGQYVQPGQVPGQYVQTGQGPGQWVDGKWVPSTGAGQWVDGKWVPAEADDADSQVLTSVQQTNNESITASAQAHGKFQGATAQSQVSGTYSGTGSFSASAGSDDGKRGALTQVSGGKDGALSSAQGRGGVGQSQAEVSLDAETGDTLSSAQTSGKIHGTQTQVHASEKGGLADAQANGPGPTSSQAQIGFTPYDGNETDNQTSPFKGGGTAAAQSGTNTGMTQTQIQGKFRYGIRYQGAAQAGAGSTALRNLTEPTGFFKPLNFTARRNATKHKGETQSQSQQAATAPSHAKRSESKPTIENSSNATTTPKPSNNQTEKSINREELMQVHSMMGDDQVVITSEESTLPPLEEEPEYYDEGEEEEEEEESTAGTVASNVLSSGPTRRNLQFPWAVESEPIITDEKPQSIVDSLDSPRESSEFSEHTQQQKQHIVLESLEPTRSTKPKPKVVSQTDHSQKQHIVLNPLEDLDATVHQSKGDPYDGMVLQPGQTIPGSPGFQIPAGFRGRVTAIANGPNTYAIGKNAQAQSVTLSPGSGKIYYSKSSNPVYGVVTKTTYKNGQYGTGYSYQPIYHPVGYRVRSGKVLPNFVSVSKSEAGSTDLATGRRKPDVYYTQSSSCGMFTNTCVYTNGRKTCFPVRKTNPDGSPMAC